MSNMGSHTFYERPAGETTEWEDILRKKGIIKPDPEEESREEAAAAAQAIAEAAAKYDPREGLSLDGLKELEETGKYDDDNSEMERLRQKRIAELKAKTAAEKFGDVREISAGTEVWTREVNEASKAAWVVVFVYIDSVLDCKLLHQCLAALAPKHKAVKFVRILASNINQRWDERNVPVLIFYHEGENVGQIQGIEVFGGQKMNVKTLEWVLADKGILKTDQEEDPRERIGRSAIAGAGAFGRRRRDDDHEDDDDDR